MSPIEKKPIVSVIVITYNSSKFVLETIYSIINQSYQNIELIISDDGSKDNTVSICKHLLAKNSDRFIRTKLITSHNNTGIPANCNRGIKASQGEWIKLIAGDDILLSNCIQDNIDFSFLISNKGIIISDMILFSDTKEVQEKIIKPNLLFKKKKKINSPLYQFQFLLRSSFGNSPSIFIKKKVFIELGFFDERFKLIEDHPFSLKATKSGYNFIYMNKATVKYRKSSDSVFMSSNMNQIFNAFYIKKRDFEKTMIYPHISYIERIILTVEYYRLKFIENLGLNKNKIFCKLIYYASKAITPFFYYKLIMKKIF